MENSLSQQQRRLPAVANVSPGSEWFMVEKAQQKNRESRLRSILKAFTWRIIATITTISIAYIITGDLSAAGAVGLLDFFIKLLLYYFHERIWQLLPRGSIRKMVHPSN